MKYAICEEIIDVINAHFEIYKTHGIDGVNKFYNCDTTIFNIGSVRGGWNQFGGPFWLDHRQEKLDTRFNQVIGHTKTSEPKKIINRQSWYVPIDTTKYVCYNTETGNVEDFLPESLEDQRDMLEKVCY